MEIKRTTFTITNEHGKEISFAEHAKELGPSLYLKDFEGIIKGWKHADWIYTDEYIAPMVSQIVTDACELDPEMFAEIMTIIEKAYHKFQPIISPYHLSLVE